MKIGSARFLSRRLGSYQTGSPHRDYQYVGAVHVQDRHAAEFVLHEELQGYRLIGTEWFRLSPEDALLHLERLDKKGL